MQLSQDIHTGLYHIKSYTPGAIKINDHTYSTSMIVGLNTLQEWTLKNFAEINSEHWKPIIDLKPELIILGTGESIQFPTPELLAPLYQLHIGVEFMSTQAACRTFEVLAAENRQVIAALLL